ncbi:uncharacterized protein LOC108682947 isoform X1 [Hyalella azteca]|uniref:Uncharacterized protein LOC108682947 isoform X1 n=1 Tax=Hyalella azteca TaxID=294128 RepID=A0A8B7PNX5_HYAAZ|nr:uncharacterized protein LOC108682947 isoform X1 [Hyalella azteca]
MQNLTPPLVLYPRSLRGAGSMKAKFNPSSRFIPSNPQRSWVKEYIIQPLLSFYTLVPSEELGVGGADLASLFGKRRRRRQIFGGEDQSNAQSFGNALSTGAGIFGSALGIFLDSVWEAFRNFLRATETVGLLALDTKNDLILGTTTEAGQTEEDVTEKAVVDANLNGDELVRRRRRQRQ